MKILYAFLLLLLAVCSACDQKNQVPQSTVAGPRYLPQDTVVYPVSAASSLDKMTNWYNAFFGIEARREENYASYTIDHTVVIVTTDPNYAQTKEPIYLWQLPRRQSITEDFERVRGIEETQPDAGYEQGPIDISNSPSTTPEAADSLVHKYIVLDPSGNKVGVVNNPIYVPRLVPGNK
ncbi:hypothetical protein [Hymenobacter psychrotolerans]|uniref:Glyoxalase-like domain-containing protein n=1 Tax=Hymenobacter psychrotolerans DSM 18569 TaxID=1121959 RepID=A0A1M7BXW2_9BACT|nr:hypothetical protein [Hymenobacter psychrotolerans]SHL59835.1 hypothetical protein SAMN02746009_03045 [Hymenobacter psychrotolerans DSM 18569]